MRTAEGKEVFHKLVATADVLYESGTPGSKNKLTADYDSVVKTNPNIVYASFPAYGFKGPYSHLPSHGWGVMAFTNTSPIEDLGNDRLRSKDTGQKGGFTDAGPMITAMSIIAAVVQKLKTGKGAHIDVAMCDPLLYAQHSDVFPILNPQYPVGLVHFERTGTSLPIRFNYYWCKDRKVLAFQATEKKFWVPFLKIVGRDDWLKELEENPWPIALDIGNYEPDKEQAMIDIMLTKTLDEWMDLLGHNDVPVIPGYNLEQLLADDHVKERNLIVEQDQPGFGKVKQVSFPILLDDADFSASPAPWAGKDNVDVIKGLGYTDQQIQAMQTQKILAEDTRLTAKAGA
jgi:crotonobetainyl-CoA:carnitine CoA-transferase CaiB-like acyl-CoA transferase